MLTIGMIGNYKEIVKFLIIILFLLHFSEVYQHADVFSDENRDDESDTASVMSKHVNKSKREIREEQESKVYTLATDTLIKSLMTEYKKRKQHHAMPAFVKISKEKKPKPILKKTESVDESIAKQRKSSIMKVS